MLSVTPTVSRMHSFSYQPDAFDKWQEAVCRVQWKRVIWGNGTGAQGSRNGCWKQEFWESLWLCFNVAADSLPSGHRSPFHLASLNWLCIIGLHKRSRSKVTAPLKSWDNRSYSCCQLVLPSGPPTLDQPVLPKNPIKARLFHPAPGPSLSSCPWQVAQQTPECQPVRMD